MIKNLPKVINIKTDKDKPNVLYIGRPKTKGKSNDKTKDLNGHFGNPFILKKESDRNQVLTNFKNWLDGKAFQHIEPNRRLWILENLNKIQTAKYLGCYCHPKPCHGDILIEFVKEKNHQNFEIPMTRD